MKNSTRILIHSLAMNNVLNEMAMLRALRDKNKTYVKIAIRALPPYMQALILKEID